MQGKIVVHGKLLQMTEIEIGGELQSLMEIQLAHSEPFNLDFTLCCGQAFRCVKHGEWWYCVAREKIFRIRQINNKLEFENANPEFIKDFLGFRDDLLEIYSEIVKDKLIGAAVKRFRGLRILRQDPWECLISYICATYKNILAIRQMLSNLARKFGYKIVFHGHDFHTFPQPADLAKTKIKDLIECGLGYRAKYIMETARIIYEKVFELESLGRMSYEEARKELLNLPGVGLKVADCVLLFSLEKLEAFPVDVWIKRVLLKHYADHFGSMAIQKISSKNSLTSSEYGKLNLFGRKYFGSFAGYAQEYLYHLERTRY